MTNRTLLLCIVVAGMLIGALVYEDKCKHDLAMEEQHTMQVKVQEETKRLQLLKDAITAKEGR